VYNRRALAVKNYGKFPVLLWVVLIVGIVVWNVLLWLTFTQRIR
jgi:hypothetical protein